MSADIAELWTLAGSFTFLSFLAIGGVNALLPEIHRLVVDVNGWMTSERFADFYAISQAAPGPNLSVISLIGWTVGGLPGFLVINIAFIAPTSILTYFLARTWSKFRDARWRIAIQNGLLPVTIGLVSAGAVVLARSADDSIAAVALTAVAAGLGFLTSIHPLVLIGAGAALGAAGLL